jgi:hypothetical protein
VVDFGHAGSKSFANSVGTLLTELKRLPWSKKAVLEEEAAEQLQTLESLGGSHLVPSDLRRLLGCLLLVVGVGGHVQSEGSGMAERVIAVLSRHIEGSGSDEGVAFLADVGPQGLEAFSHLATSEERPKKDADSYQLGPLPLLHSITRR